MLKSLRAGARFFQNNIGWNRIGVLLSLAIIAVAVVVLVHMLRDINVDEVIAALKATELRHIAAAAAFVAGGYFTLTFYDLFALRTIGRNGNSLSDRGAFRLHQLFDRPQYRRHRVHRRRGALPHLFGLRPRRHRGGENLFRRGPDVLARQRHRAGSRRRSIRRRPRACSINCRTGPTAAWQARCLLMLACLSRLGLERAARDRPRRMESLFAERAVDAAANLHRHSRSRLLRARHVHAAAGRAEYRLRDAGGGVRVGDDARLRQPRARRARRVRRRHAGGACGNSTRKTCWRGCCCSGCFIISCRSSLRWSFWARAKLCSICAACGPIRRPQR